MANNISKPVYNITWEDFSDRVLKLAPFTQTSYGENVDILQIANLGGAIVSLRPGESDKAIGLTKEELLDFVKDNNIKINNALRDFLRGETEKCIKVIDTLFGVSNIAQFTVIEPKHLFFRMRPSSSGYLYSREEMFHIPFELRSKVSNQRYSYSGYPSLYLADRIYGCWEELGRPSIADANIVGIINAKPLKLLNLRMPESIRSKEDINWIMWVLACSVTGSKHDDPFKVEYVIPQMILHSLIKHNKQIENSDERIHGIVYTSVHAGNPQRLYDYPNFFTNYVIPVLNKEDKDKGYCETLSDEFLVSDPTSVNVEKVKPQINDLKFIPDRNEPGILYYSRTDFGYVEAVIYSQFTRYPFKPIGKGRIPQRFRK